MDLIKSPIRLVADGNPRRSNGRSPSSRESGVLKNRILPSGLKCLSSSWSNNFRLDNLSHTRRSGATLSASHRWTEDVVTSSTWANSSWVAPSFFRRSRIARPDHDSPTTPGNARFPPPTRRSSFEMSLSFRLRTRTVLIVVSFSANLLPSWHTHRCLAAYFEPLG